MKLNETKCTILENDEENDWKGLDRGLKHIMDLNPQIKFDIWYRFSSSFHWAKEENMKRLAELGQDKDHFFLTYPSFIGYDNKLDGWVWLFNKLTVDYGFKSKFLITYYGDLWYELLELMHENRNEDRENIKNVLNNNEVFCTKYVDVQLYDSFEEIEFYQITYESLVNNLYKRGEKVRIKESGKICEVVYQHVGDDRSLVDVIINYDLDERLNSGKTTTDEYKTFMTHEIEKI